MTLTNLTLFKKMDTTIDDTKNKSIVKMKP